MKLDELSIKYEPQKVEEGKYDLWLKHKSFLAGKDPKKVPFSLVIPPPNITGQLHIGHVWDTTLQDIITRRKRMQGYDTLYLPGMDHASIATQARIEAKLKKEGTNKYELGREGFLKIAWQWKEDLASIIHDQWKLVGLGLDYSKERFTMDEGMNKSVTKVFKELYDKGLIYRGKRIINWDSMAKTAVSDIEVNYQEEEGFLYHIKYYFENQKDFVVIATTRPETMFADQALMVNPSDKRYTKLLGKKVLIPLTNTVIPIIEDNYVDKEFGTGIVKVTPAHDPNDYQVGMRHNLKMPLCMDEAGIMNELALNYEGLDRLECRKKVLTDLDKLGQLVKCEPIVHAVGYSERTHCLIEPRLSEQWFVKTKELAKPLIKLQKDPKKKIKFIPEQFEKIYLNWLTNIQDWCISRQLWWGHQIPVWYRADEIVVGTEPKEPGFTQDQDVLDTWFSSALWPFATLNWPDSDLFKRYYPTDVLVTGYDIIFFWVVRMALQGLYFTNEKPFKEVLLHGLVRDELGRKISKSLDNGVDIRKVINQYGIDSLRFFITTAGAPGQDIRFTDEKMLASWNFINKIWNISRYIGLQFKTFKYQRKPIDDSLLLVGDAWILKRISEVINEVNQKYDTYQFPEVAHILYKFIWNEFASWYIEISKVNLEHEEEKIKQNILSILDYVLTSIMKLLHPFMPFVTEHIYSCFKNELLVTSEWPKCEKKYLKFDSKNLLLFFDVVTTIRTVRNNFNKSLKEPIDLVIKTSDESFKKTVEDLQNILKAFVNFKDLSFTEDKKTEYLKEVLKNCEILIPESGLIDLVKEKEKHLSEAKRLLDEVERCEKLLANPRFCDKAPKEKIALEKEKLQSYKEQLQKVREIIKKYD